MSSSNPIIIYGMGGAACCQRVLMSAIENFALFELKIVDMAKKEHKSTEHLARQPFGLIPAVEDGKDFILYESRACARYVNDTRGNKLVPSDPKKRGLMEQWISLEQGTITPDISGIVSERIFVPWFGGQTNEEAIKKHTEKVKQALDIMDAHLSKNEYLTGTEFTLADLFFMPYFALLFKVPEKELIESRPSIFAWWKSISSRPSWLKTQEYNEFNKGA